MRKSSYVRGLSVRRFENLESRRMLAGDVTVTFTEGVLTLTGDDAANAFTITASDGGVTVTGLDLGGQTNIVVGGDSDTSADFLGTVNSIVISTGDGDDAVTITSITIADDATTTEAEGTLTIDTGLGRDTVTLQTVLVDGLTDIDTGRQNDTLTITGGEFGRGDTIDTADDLTINMDRGVDTITITDATIGDDLTIDLGDHNDALTISETIVQNGNADEGGTSIVGGHGGDYVTLIDVQFGAEGDTAVSIDTGGDRDRVQIEDTVEIAGTLDVQTGGGNDVVVVLARDIATGMSVSGAATFSTGTGDDILFVLDAVFESGVTLNTGDGVNFVALNDTNVTGDASIATGMNSDLASVRRLVVSGTLEVTLSGDDDALNLDDVTASVGNLDAGDGTEDDLRELVASNITTRNVTGFELPAD